MHLYTKLLLLLNFGIMTKNKDPNVYRITIRNLPKSFKFNHSSLETINTYRGLNQDEMRMRDEFVSKFTKFRESK